jgi:hypothetical protein
MKAIKKLWKFVNRRKVEILLGGAAVYLIYFLCKIVFDNGTTKDGSYYYADFDNIIGEE